MLMARNYSNIDLANKMECISQRIIISSKNYYTSSAQGKFPPLKIEMAFWKWCKALLKNQSQVILFFLPAAFSLIKLHREKQAI